MSSGILSILGRVETGDRVTSSRAQRVSELIVLVPELGADAAVEGLEQNIAEAALTGHRGPVVPADQVAEDPLLGVVLLLLVVVAVGEAPAVRVGPVLVVDHLGVRAVLQEPVVLGVLVLAVARGGHALDVVALREDDDVFPVMVVAMAKGAPDGLVLLKVVLIPVYFLISMMLLNNGAVEQCQGHLHDGAPSIVATRSAVQVVELETVVVAAIAGHALAHGIRQTGVSVSLRANGCREVTTISIEVGHGVKLLLEGRGTIA